MGKDHRVIVGEALELVVVGARERIGSISPHMAGAAEGDRLPTRASRDIVATLAQLTFPAATGVQTPPRADAGPDDLVRIYARELQIVWDAWARLYAFDSADAFRALDTARRLLIALGASAEARRVGELMTTPLARFAARALAEHVEGAREAGGLGTDSATTVADEEDRAPVAEVAADSGGGEQYARSSGTRRDESGEPSRLRAVSDPLRMASRDDPQAPASIRALREVDPALPLITWSELSDTITALLATGRIDPEVLAGLTRRSLTMRTGAAVEAAAARGTTISAEHVAWVLSVLRARYAGGSRVTRAAATALVAEYISDLAPQVGVDPRRVRQDMMAWIGVERA